MSTIPRAPMHTTLARSLFATVLSLLLALTFPALGATVTITPVPTNGTVTSNVGGINCGSGGATCTSSSITLGTSVTLTATPNTGYSFVQWSVTGLGTSTSNPLTFPMPSTSVSGSVTFVGTAPTITSANATTFTELSPGTFTVTATGTPAPTFAVTSGALPTGVTLSSGGTLSGTPASGTAGSYPVTITASNGVAPDSTQAFTLAVQSPPAITSASTASFTVASAGTFTITSTGTPTATISLTGALPTGLTFTTPVAGQGLISGTPSSGTAGSYPLTITAANGVLPNATQSFTLTVSQPPSFTSASSTTFTVGAPGSFNFTASGSPAPAFAVTAGGLPEGISLSAAGVLSGTPANGTAGVYNVSITASNGVPSDATVAFTLNVAQTPGLVATPIANFDGLGKDFTGPGGSFTVALAPSDASIAIGPSHIVQVVNSSYAVFDKTGAALQGPIALGSLWAGPLSTTCSQAAQPIARYDRAADRFVITALVNGLSSSPNLCVAVSATGDPTGSYVAYAFSLPTNVYDTPRLGVWPDGYYVTFNVFGASPSFTFQGARICVLDRSKMLAGQAATQLCFNAATYYTLVPSDLDGANAPAVGAPNTIVGLDPVTANKLDVFQFHVDWTTPANSTFTGPTILDTAAYSDPCTASTTCIPQAGTSTQLDAPGGQLMDRAAYRNFGDHESLVIVHSVNAGSSTGMRWYELRSPSTSPTIFQQGTFAPDADSRWMGSGAMDASGNLAIGYSVSSAAIKPQIRYAARLATDPAGQLSMGEATIVAGAGAQTGGLTAWGTTTSLHVDPSDDCTFWYTNQYLPADGSFNWRTRIASFRPLGACPTAPSATTGAASGVSNSAASLNATVSANLGTTTVTFEYGTTTSYGSSAVATQSPLAASASSAAVSASITGLSCATLYHFRVTATNAAGTASGNDATFTTSSCISVPGAPTIGTATPGDLQATIAFAAPASDGGSPITSYTVTCMPGPITATGATSPITVAGLANGTTYTCSVAATNAVGTGPGSAGASVTPAGIVGVAAAITSVNHATFTIQSPGTFTVTATGSPAPTLSLAGALPSGVTFTPATGVLAGTPAIGSGGSYSLMFTAMNGVLPTASQAFMLTVVKANQSIAFANPGTHAISATPFTLSATASSGLAVAFTSLTPTVCTVSGSQVTTLIVGTCTIAADQAGDGNFNAAAQVQQAFAISEPPRLFNISTRMDVLTGNNVMIAGFVIGGSTPKTLAITATGPSLAAFGITNPLPNPTLTLVRQSDHAVIATNDNWQTDANASLLQSSGFAPTNSLEAGLYVTLPPGAYTAIVQDAAGSSGVSVVGAFEIDHPEVPLINISTRGLVQTGNNVMIAGLIVQGTGPQKVLITATGPSLVPFGISNPLPNPTLTLVRQSDSSVIATNDDWQSGPNVSAIQATGNAPGNALESAILVTLDPGAYTAIVQDASGGIGVSVVGVFTEP